ncbi:MAG: hypothetical protein ACRELX_12745, partial [Longimicrobiales bacterium]
AADGLPDDRVTSIAAADDGVWVTTTRGVAFVHPDGAVAPFTLAPGRQIGRAVLARDTLWVATEAGLFFVANAGSSPPGAGPDPVLRPAPGTEAQPALRGPVPDVAVAAGVVYALTAAGLYRRGESGWSGPERAALARIGRPLRLAASGDTVWVAGEQGVAALDAATGATTDYVVPADIPAGPVLDVAPAGDVVWLGTPAGALRLRLR